MIKGRTADYSDSIYYNETLNKIVLKQNSRERNKNNMSVHSKIT